MPPRLPILFISIVLIACGPLVPLYHPQERIDNPPIIFESNEIKMSLCFLGRKYGHNVFALELVNQLESEVAFSPKSISMLSSSKPFPFPFGTEDLDSISEANSKIIPTRVFAKSQEEVMEMTQDAANNRAALGAFFAILTVGAVLVDNVKDDEDSRKEYFTRGDAQRANTRDAIVMAGRLSSEIAFSSANNALDFGYTIAEEVFPVCKIWAGGSKQGRIFIPNPTTYRYTRVIIPLNGIDYVFDFRLRGRKPPGDDQ
jgi:hypothetical protein